MPGIQNQTSSEVRLEIQGNADAILYITICAINGAFSLTALLGNIVVLGAIWRTPSLHIPSNVFLFGLAVSDFAVGLIVLPTFIAFLILEFTTETHVIQKWTAFRSVQAVFVCATVLTLTSVSVDRIIALTFHLKYQAIFTIKRAGSILSFIWIVSIAYGLTIVFSEGLYSHLSIAVFSSCLVVNSLAYLVIYRIARRHLVQIQAQQQIQTQQQNGTLNIIRYRKSVINMFLLFMLFALCYVPYIFVRVYTKFADWNSVHVVLALRLSAMLVYLNSSLNPLLYCWRMREMRVGMKRFLKALC